MAKVYPPFLISKAIADQFFILQSIRPSNPITCSSGVNWRYNIAKAQYRGMLAVLSMYLSMYVCVSMYVCMRQVLSQLKQVTRYGGLSLQKMEDNIVKKLDPKKFQP